MLPILIKHLNDKGIIYIMNKGYVDIYINNNNNNDNA